jgi:prepilin-type processing-associated H-X9-DG protein
VLDKQAFHAVLGSNHAVNYLYADGHIKNLLIIAGTQ